VASPAAEVAKPITATRRMEARPNAAARRLPVLTPPGSEGQCEMALVSAVALISAPIVSAVGRLQPTGGPRCVISAEPKTNSAPDGQNPSDLRLVVWA
jgi:hypothetical protein